MRAAQSLTEAAAATLRALHTLHPTDGVLDTVLLLAEHMSSAREAAALLQCCSEVANASDHAATLLAPTCPLWRALYVVHAAVVPMPILSHMPMHPYPGCSVGRPSRSASSRCTPAS